jgi:hypothetical protein
MAGGKSRPMAKKLKKWRRRVVIAAVIPAALLAYTYWPGQVELIISPATTYITAPLNADGTPNYVAYLDANNAKDVTPGNNAAPLLLRVLGPDQLGWDCPKQEKDEILARLNMTAEELDSGPYLVSWENHEQRAEALAKGVDPKQYMEERSYNGPEFDKVRQDLLAGKVHPHLKAWLACNAEPLKLIQEAADKQKLYVPMVSYRDMPGPHGGVSRAWIAHLFDAVGALSARAVLRMSGNDPRGAWEDILTGHRLARLRGQSPHLSDKLGAMEMDKGCAITGIWLATNGHTSAPEMRQVLASLSSLQPVGDTIKAFDHADRFRTLHWAIEVYQAKDTFRTDMPNASELDWNRMLRDINQHYDNKAKLFQKFRRRVGKWSIREFLIESGEDLRSLASSRVRPPMWLCNHGGRLLRPSRTDWVTVGLMQLSDHANPYYFDHEDQANMSRDIETLAVALACYHDETDRWPASLKELSPSLLKAIPIDRFNGKPLIYKPRQDGYLLYSVGKNRDDDNGVPASNKSRFDDIIAEVKPSRAGTRPAQTIPPEASSRQTTSQP